jgi:hypothetical protein
MPRLTHDRMITDIPPAFAECVDDPLIVLPPPSPHAVVRINDTPDVNKDSLLLSYFVMKRHVDVERCERFENGLDVDLWSTCNTNT